jgi:hypothetical protein
VVRENSDASTIAMDTIYDLIVLMLPKRSYRFHSMADFLSLVYCCRFFSLVVAMDVFQQRFDVEA